MENGRLYDFKLVNDYRIRKSDNTWIRVEEQHRILETDPYGNIWLALSKMDVTNIAEAIRNASKMGLL